MSGINVLIKPASSMCNLRCSYCFYADEASHREVPSYELMSGDTVTAIIDKVLACSREYCEFGFQGGEPMLAGKAWFRHFVEEARQKNVGGCELRFSLQTNATLIDEEWAQFFKENGFLLGVSLDGPKKTTIIAVEIV